MTTAGWLRLGYGMVLLISPGRVLAMLADDAEEPHEEAVARVLGLREVAQAVVCASRPTPSVTRWGTYVDTTHAVTMVGLAGARPKWRGPALFSALIAAGFAVEGLRAAKTMPDGSALPRSFTDE